MTWKSYFYGHLKFYGFFLWIRFQQIRIRIQKIRIHRVKCDGSESLFVPIKTVSYLFGAWLVFQLRKLWLIVKYLLCTREVRQKDIKSIIPFNNPLKVYFSHKKYPITIQTRPTQIVQMRNMYNSSCFWVLYLTRKECQISGELIWVDIVNENIIGALKMHPP